LNNNQVTTMAKAQAKPSKSAMIREALAANPEKSAAEIAKEAGVTPALVYNVKAGMKKKSAKSKKKPGPKSGSKAPAKAATPQGAHDALDAAFDFINRVGGLLHAEQLIDKLKSIRERF
jgi:hypothetical protein